MNRSYIYNDLFAKLISINLIIKCIFIIPLIFNFHLFPLLHILIIWQLGNDIAF